MPVLVSICRLMSRPEPGGRGSLRSEAPLAVAPPLFAIVTVKPALCPADDVRLVGRLGQDQVASDVTVLRHRHRLGGGAAA